MKTATDENVYEIDYTNRNNLSEMCELRQPFTFKLEKNIDINHNVIEGTGTPLNILKSKAIVIKKKEKEKEGIPEETMTKIYSEYNSKLVTNDNIINELKSIEEQIIPEFTCNNSYDVIVSDDQFKSPITSNFNFRNFFLVTEGSIKIRFMSHKHNNKFDNDIDYELMQNVSSYDVWENPDKLHVSEISATKGDMIYIPPFWWYSIHYIEPTVIVKYQYRTIMNIVCNLYHYACSYVTISKIEENGKNKDLKIKQN